jgi:hypothetical protein
MEPTTRMTVQEAIKVIKDTDVVVREMTLDTPEIHRNYAAALERLQLANPPRQPASSRMAVDEGDGYDHALWEMDLGPKERQLHEWGSYGRTDALKRLLVNEGDDMVTPTFYDILELWKTFREAEGYHDAETTLTEFAKWILGAPPTGMENSTDEETLAEVTVPCQVYW